ncbi:uncharacterized protein LOC134202660 [Armigeres subalbatus]|uniref:uncharacterized protein LOC134202660 n=1 Tax=Armigeres subalbatus TaxID=124917 RepID=UPI002ED18C13
MELGLSAMDGSIGQQQMRKTIGLWTAASTWTSPLLYVAEYDGNVTMYSVINDKVKKCEAKNVLYLPGLSCNLFSVKRITRAGLQVCFDEDKAKVMKNGAVGAVGRLKGELYELDIFCKRDDMGSAMVSGKVSRNAMEIKSTTSRQQNSSHDWLSRKDQSFISPPACRRDYRKPHKQEIEILARSKSVKRQMEISPTESTNRGKRAPAEIETSSSPDEYQTRTAK